MLVNCWQIAGKSLTNFGQNYANWWQIIRLSVIVSQYVCMYVNFQFIHRVAQATFSFNIKQLV